MVHAICVGRPSALARLRRAHSVAALVLASRIPLPGVHFSLAAPSPVPVTLEPHLLVLVHCPEDASGSGALEVTYQRDRAHGGPHREPRPAPTAHSAHRRR